ncbi:HAMP domain-containing methyl-accepting chemotaxis protein [Bradyrhizobium sp.]|uniref:methyl-accepting chemotaxis protein n=1 Tax=Bradyrhizobium sp. TaxID=376 RepID=UPI0025C5FBB2|nr:HAMP domain-containing methyl-accepting chemotaxis protein [Bradyrhizobium sp.]
MLKRISVTALLTSIVLFMATCIVAMLAVTAWQSFDRLKAAGRISVIAGLSRDAFVAMHRLRTDRSTTNRTLNGDAVLDPELEKIIREFRDSELPALRGVLEVLPSVDFPEQPAQLSELSRLTQTMFALDKESWEAFRKPKAERRPGLAKEYMDVTGALSDALDRMSANLAAAVKHSDAVIDQWLELKQAAWLLRLTTGEASLLVSNGVGGAPLPPNARLSYTQYVGGAKAAWAAVELAASGTKLPPALADALKAAKQANFDPEYTTLRDRLFDQVANGQKPEMNVLKWSPLTVERMGTAVTIAERALDAAKDHARAQEAEARRDLIVQSGLLVGALALAFAIIVGMRRRVITPLKAIGEAMHRVAGGDLSIAVPFADRHDEIGALAGALESFKQAAIEKERIEEAQRVQDSRTASRQQTVEAHIGRFESKVRDTLATLRSASEKMRSTSEGMSSVSAETNAQVRQASAASAAASSHVQSVAAASEQLSVSIADISRQVSHAASIAGRAVEQTRQTDGTVQGLAATASRIGEVVELINSIAGQTNLLALNATIEAARAGEAGKGFAVVASEVKSLATQTAKATEEISQQISAVQNVASEAVEAIKGIGGIIGEVSQVATAIAAAVEEQGAATQEITRSTQQAAHGTQQAADNLTGVTKGAAASGAAAADVKSAAEVLAVQTRELSEQVDGFLNDIRAA